LQNRGKVNNFFLFQKIYNFKWWYIEIVCFY
jgi:hypothetical protein